MSAHAISERAKTNASARADYNALSGAIAEKFLAFSMALKDSSIDANLRELVYLRASQMNGCGFCVDMHVKQARIHGERELRLHHVAVWRESPLFDARERAALEWTEVLTRLPVHGVSDRVYEHVRANLGEKELSDLTFSVMAINGWNRISIAFQSVPGSADAMLGLTKAGMS
ncbi:carboxymuconolactone decarboxylase family protein [Breoghania sp. L-A4]|nr:carboxymuconolactone decarboxylase family protein [Breoghania sp. L-A4]